MTTETLNPVQVLLWGALPYVTIAVFIVGLIWRHRYDKFGWTTRSSQLYEGRLIRIASPVFHYGILAVAAGHFLGLVIPESWTTLMPETAYHYMSLTLGLLAGLATLIGIALLIYRRRTTGPVFSATTKNDKVMYIFLAGAICLGLAATIYGGILSHPSYNYRETISPWFRSIFYFNPQIGLMTDVPMVYQIHIVAAMVLFIIWPFTRLVHVFSAPISYPLRPYVVYRDRGSHDQGSRPARRGWEKVGGP